MLFKYIYAIHCLLVKFSSQLLILFTGFSHSLDMSLLQALLFPSISPHMQSGRIVSSLKFIAQTLWLLKCIMTTHYYYNMKGKLHLKLFQVTLSK